MPTEKNLEVLQIQCLLGGEGGLDPDKVQPGFFVRLSDHLTPFLKEEGLEPLTIHQSFEQDENYQGASREFQLTRFKGA